MEHPNCKVCAIGNYCRVRPNPEKECELYESPTTTLGDLLGEVAKYEEGNEMGMESQNAKEIGYATYTHPDELGNMIEDLERITNEYEGKISWIDMRALTYILALLHDTDLRGLTNVPADVLERGPNITKWEQWEGPTQEG